MRIGSLFSGVGGLELGLERALPGSRVVWQVEIDPKCREVLALRWPDAIRYPDVRNLPLDLPAVDLLCGGFPCQDLSSASARGDARPGLQGAKSGLWAEYAKVIGRIRPETVVVENVASGKEHWLPQVRRDLHVLGYGSLAIPVSAADVGALHQRRRIFVVAHPYRGGESVGPLHAQASPVCPHAIGVWHRWPAEPPHLRMANGLPGRVAWRNRAYGNAVVPQAAQAVGLAIASGWTRGLVNTIWAW